MEVCFGYKLCVLGGCNQAVHSQQLRLYKMLRCTLTFKYPLLTNDSRKNVIVLVAICF